jgi:hypothetical protein
MFDNITENYPILRDLIISVIGGIIGTGLYDRGKGTPWNEILNSLTKNVSVPLPLLSFLILFPPVIIWLTEKNSYAQRSSFLLFGVLFSAIILRSLRTKRSIFSDPSFNITEFNTLIKAIAARMDTESLNDENIKKALSKAGLYLLLTCYKSQLKKGGIISLEDIIILNIRNTLYPSDRGNKLEMIEKGVKDIIKDLK